MVLLGEVLAQRVERTEMDLTSLEVVERTGEAPDDARRRDPEVRFALAHPEQPNAEIPHRGAGVLHVEASLLDLGG